MAESVFNLMKAAAAASIPRYCQGLADLEAFELANMLDHLRAHPLPAQVLVFLAAVESYDTNSYTCLEQLATHEILELHQGIQECWSQIQEEGPKRAIRHLYQLVAAHFFLYHAQDASHDSAA